MMNMNSQLPDDGGCFAKVLLLTFLCLPVLATPRCLSVSDMIQINEEEFAVYVTNHCKSAVARMDLAVLLQHASRPLVVCKDYVEVNTRRILEPVTDMSTDPDSTWLVTFVVRKSDGIPERTASVKNVAFMDGTWTGSTEFIEAARLSWRGQLEAAALVSCLGSIDSPKVRDGEELRMSLLTYLNCAVNPDLPECAPRATCAALFARNARSRQCYTAPLDRLIGKLRMSSDPRETWRVAVDEMKCRMFVLNDVLARPAKHGTAGE